MAYSQNAFSVTSFGESTEPTNVTVTLTGVFGSIDVNGAALGVASISRVIVSGVEGTLQVGTVGIGMGVVPTGVSATGAVEQVQVDGFEIDVQERLASVSATGVINGALTHSNTHSISSVVGTFNVGNTTVTGVAFNFIAADYDRKRVVYIPRQDTAAERRVAA